MNARFTYPLTLAMLILASGCGGSDREIPEPIASVDVLYASAVRSSIEDLRSAEGPAAVIENAQYALEDMEGYEEEEGAAPHLETYQKIYQGFEAISQMKGASQADIRAKVDEMAALVDTLPKLPADAGGGEAGGGE